MRKLFAKAPLGEVLTKSEEWVALRPDEKYRQVTVRLWGQGVVLRNEVSGAEIAATKRLMVREGQFILSRIDARNGAFGIVPASLDGAVVSNDFPAFTPNPERILPDYLGWMSRTRDFVALCKATSEGTTNRVRLNENRFLATLIPLPPLAEQRCIVARIEALAAKIAEARGLRRQAVEEADAICRSLVFNPRDAVTTIPMHQLVRLREPDVVVQGDQEYHFAGVYSFGRGVFQGQRKSGMETAYPRLSRLSTGNFVYPKLMAWEGALAIVPPECDGLVVSPEFPVFEVDQSRVLPETLDVYFRTPTVWPILSGTSTGTNVRRRRLNPKDFLDFQFPLPSMSTQRQLRDIKARVDVLKRLQAETTAELDALLPRVLDKAFQGEL